MLIQITILDKRGMILEYKNFFTNPPKPEMVKIVINKYIEESMKEVRCQQITIRKWQREDDENRKTHS
jgi:hypothetical protein